MDEWESHDKLVIVWSSLCKKKKQSKVSGKKQSIKNKDCLIVIKFYVATNQNVNSSKNKIYT